MSALFVKVSTKQVGKTEVFSGTVTIPGLRPTKVARRSDGSTTFSSKSSLFSSARSVAKALGFDGVTDTTTIVKKAAKTKARTCTHGTGK